MVSQKKETTVQLSQSIQVSEDFKELFHGYFMDKSAKEISKLLNQPFKTAFVSFATHRQINSWDELGLISYTRQGSDWRMYTIVELTWLNIVHQLRTFGYPTSQVKKVKKSLEEGSNKVKVKMPLLEFCVEEIITRKKPMVLLAFADGSSIVIPFTDYKANLEDRRISNHLHIDLNEIVQWIFSKSNLSPVFEKIGLSNEEKHLLEFIRSGTFEAVRIKYKDGKMQKFDATERVNAERKIVEILHENDYQNIEVIQRDKKIVSIVRTVSKKIIE